MSGEGLGCSLFISKLFSGVEVRAEVLLDNSVLLPFRQIKVHISLNIKCTVLFVCIHFFFLYGIPITSKYFAI